MAYGTAVYGLDGADFGATLIGVSIVFVLELLTLCMAAMSSTGRWIEAREARAYAAAAMYAPQLQYPYYGQ
ncbi:hypothetical protein [Nocardia sp. GAS34]|uniref:hypothetical protein n=1 Tax=unclassified Nocardia TaxID=2637762 RepID=UPI003D21EC40